MAAPRFRSQAAVFLHTLLGTLPGRAMLAGLGLKALVYLAEFATSVPSDPDVVNARDLLSLSVLLALLDTAAGVAIAVGAIYFLFRLFLIARRRLLWRVRRKLILSYVFIGVVPVMLVGAFFLLCGLLLFFNFSSYLVQAELTSLDDRARLLATSAALEVQGGIGGDVAAVLDRKLKTLAPELAGASIAVVPVDRPCAAAAGASTQPARPPAPPSVMAGPWTHVVAPTALPPWIGCDGVSALFAYTADGDTHVLVRAVAFPESAAPRYGVIVDLPVEGDAIERLRRQTGVVLRSVTAVERREGSAAPLANRPAASTSAPLGWVTFLDYRDWETGETQPLLVSTQVSLSGIYARIVAAQGLIGNRSIGQALLLVLLLVVGGLFLVIEVVALVVGLALAKSITGSVHELFVGTERVRQGDFTKIAVTAEDQLGELAQSFNSMTASVEDLLRQSAEKKRLEEELRIAHEIQMSLLPQAARHARLVSHRALRARAGGGRRLLFSAARRRPCGRARRRRVGQGDLRGALHGGAQGPHAVAVSDPHVAPRPAHQREPHHFRAPRPAQLHHDDLRHRGSAGGDDDLRARRPYAPHPCAWTRRSDASRQILAPDGLVLGLKIDGAGPLFERLLVEETIRLREGDLYVFFTDGISEAMNSADDCFGETRLGRVLEGHADLPPDQLRERVLREVEVFVGGAPQHDDMTMILLRVDNLPVAAPIDAETAEFAGR